MNAEMSFLVELALKSTVVLAAAFAIMRLGRRLAAEERHVVWAVALASLLALPILSLSGPRIGVPVDRLFASAASALAARSATPPNATKPTAASSASSAKTDRAGAAAGSTAKRSGSPSAPAASAAANGSDASASPTAAGLAEWISLLALYPSAIALYLLAATLLLAYFAAAALRVAVSLHRLPEVSDPGALALLEGARESQGVRRRVRLKVSKGDATPWAWGVLRPVVVVPEGFTALPAEAQRDALVHELAHIARFDFVTTLLACAICALYWFQPLAWLALRRMARETEQACDDRVLLAGGTHTSYATQLLETAHAIRRIHRPMAATAMARSSSVSTRIASILDPNIRRKAVNGRYVGFVSILTAAVLIPVASLDAQEAATPPVPADHDSAAFAALAQRGPANDDELSLLVDTYVTHGRQADAVDVLARYISRDLPMPADASKWWSPEPSCRFCAEVLSGEKATPGDSGEMRQTVSAALDEVEKRAREANDGSLLVRLAEIFGASGNTSAIGRATYFLMEGFRLGHLTPASDLTAISLLTARGWATEAKELAQGLYDDPSSSLYQSDVLIGRIRMLDGEIKQRDFIAKRLLEPNATISYKDADVAPLYRQPPQYPPSALKQHVEGFAQFRFTITNEGKTKDIAVVAATNDEFAQSAREALSDWLYAPEVVDGVAVERPGVQTIIRFVLTD